MAMKGWEIGADVEQVMASELRAAYVQMAAVWKHLPEEYRLDTMDDGWWASEARNGMMATYDHPTPQSLLFVTGRGGFGPGEDRRSYAATRGLVGPTRARVRVGACLSRAGAGCRRVRRVARGRCSAGSRIGRREGAGIIGAIGCWGTPVAADDGAASCS